MQKREIGNWIYYISEDDKARENCGKWMYFFDNEDFVSGICEKAIQRKIVTQCKHSNDETGVSCFYLSANDIEGHKKVISYFLENNLIKKTKAGKLYNISFKLDSQTRAGEYGADFQANLKLTDFLDLTTGEFK